MEEYNRLYKIYVEKSDDELREIINPANGYTEIHRPISSDSVEIYTNAYTR